MFKINLVAVCAALIICGSYIPADAGCPYLNEDIWPDQDPGQANYSIVVDAKSPIRNTNPMMNGLQVFWRRYSMGLVEEKQNRTGPVAYHVSHQEGGTTIPCLKARLDEFSPQLLTFPPNNEATIYNFRDGIGPRQDYISGNGDEQERPGRPGSTPDIFPNHMGTDEFIDLCKSYGAQPVILINICGRRVIPDTLSEEDWSKAAQLAANWVEYCNSRVTSKIRAKARAEGWKPTTWSGEDPYKVEVKEQGKSWLSNDVAPQGYFAWLREHFGHSSPYAVRYWLMGDELFFTSYSWATADEYKKRFVQIVDAMRSVDPTVAPGIQALLPMSRMGIQDSILGNAKPWTPTVLGVDGNNGTNAYQRAEFIDIHIYEGPQSVYGELMYWCNGRFQRTVDVQQTGICAIRTSLKNAGGITDVLLLVDGVPQTPPGINYTWQVASNSYVDYEWQIMLNEGTHEIKLIETNYASLLYVPWVKVVQGDAEITLTDRITEYRKIFGSIEGEINEAQEMLNTYPDKDLLIAQSNVSYASTFSDIPINKQEDCKSIHCMKSALGVIHLQNRLMHLKSKYSDKGVIGKSHWEFPTRGAFDFDLDGYVEARWETLYWRLAYCDYVGDVHRCGVTSTYHLLLAYRKYAKGTLVSCQVTGKQFGVPLNRDTWWDHERYLNYVDAIAVKDGQRVRILAANRDSVPARFRIVAGGLSQVPQTINVYTYQGKGFESDTVEVSNIKVKYVKPLYYTLPPCSLVVFEF